MSLKTCYAPYFKIGAAISAMDLNNASRMELLKDEFSSFTCENDMKPMFFMDKDENQKNPEKYEKNPAMTTKRAIPFLEFAKENQIPMRGHTLVWHNQTPKWFFYQKYDENGELADRETMLARLDNYIHYVLDFVQTQYPGVIYAWDVVNEAVDEGDFRKSLWLKTVGRDFVQKAFESARKYAAPDVKLFYNDYETAQEWKRDFIIREILVPLKEKGLLDGMGMQSHLLMDHPDPKVYQTALHMYGALGIEVQITELDMHNADPSDESMDQLAQRYQEFFSILIHAKKEGKANITSVTFWNLLDETSWLTGFRRAKSYPLLFGAVAGRKEAYYKVLEAACDKETAEKARDDEPEYLARMATQFKKDCADGIRKVYEFIKNCGTYEAKITEGEQPFAPSADPGASDNSRIQQALHLSENLAADTLDLLEEKLYIRTGTPEKISDIPKRLRAELHAVDTDGKSVRVFGNIVCEDDSDAIYFAPASAFFASPAAPPDVLSF